MGCIYQVENKINGKRYIGKTVKTMMRRKTSHEVEARRGSNLYFHRALRKHGLESFDWKVLSVSDDESKLNLLEQVWIKSLGTKVPNGYNLIDGGDGVIGHKHSVIAKAKMSKIRKGKTKSAIHRARIAAAHKGIRPTIETRIKISKANMGKPSPLKGKVLSAEHRAKISATRTGKKYGPLSPDHRAKIKAALNSPETKAKLSKSLVERWKRPGYRDRHSMLMMGNKYHLGAKDSEETRAKKSKARKRFNARSST